MCADAVTKFWDNYIAKTAIFGVPVNLQRRYVRHVENYIDALSSRRLAQHSAEMVTNYLENLGRDTRITDWQFRQLVEALQILSVEVLHSHWSTSFPWHYWISLSGKLPTSSANVTISDASDDKHGSILRPHTEYVDEDTGILEKVSRRYPDYFDGLIRKIRTKHYSIGTKGRCRLDGITLFFRLNTLDLD